MSDEPIKPGDVVFLKSGSPPLTMMDKAKIRETHVIVSWFEGSVHQITSLHRDALTKVNPAQLNVAQAQLDAAYVQHNEDLKKIDELQTTLSARGLEIAKLTVARDTAQQEIEKIQAMFELTPVDGTQPVAYAVRNMLNVLDTYVRENTVRRERNIELLPKWIRTTDALPPVQVTIMVMFHSPHAELNTFKRWYEADTCPTVYQWAHIPAAWMPQL